MCCASTFFTPRPHELRSSTGSHGSTTRKTGSLASRKTPSRRARSRSCTATAAHGLPPQWSRVQTKRRFTNWHGWPIPWSYGSPDTRPRPTRPSGKSHGSDGSCHGSTHGRAAARACGKRNPRAKAGAHGPTTGQPPTGSHTGPRSLAGRCPCSPTRTVRSWTGGTRHVRLTTEQNHTESLASKKKGRSALGATDTRSHGLRSGHMLTSHGSSETTLAHRHHLHMVLSARRLAVGTR